MSEPARHCPFLNRSDARCSSRFSLDHLSDAMEYCADAYAACPVYQELLLERRVRRAEAGIAGRGRPGAGAAWGGGDAVEGPPLGGPVVALTLSAAGARHAGR